MEKFTLDYSMLQNSLNKPQMYRLADVKHKVEKVAFDVVRFIDNDKIDGLWKIERQGDDEYIVAMYEDTQKVAEAAVREWEVLAQDNYLQFFYKNAAVKKLAVESLGFDKSEINSVCKLINKKFASDSNFVNLFVSELSESEKDVIKEVSQTK